MQCGPQRRQTQDCAKEQKKKDKKARKKSASMANDAVSVAKLTANESRGESAACTRAEKEAEAPEPQAQHTYKRTAGADAYKKGRVSYDGSQICLVLLLMVR